MSDLKYSKIVKLNQTGNASFTAFRANRKDYNQLLSPIMGFDDFRLSSDVFGPHQHRHMSALSYLFEDSADYHNKDSMAGDLTITTGSLLWTWAGSGVTHHEFPERDNEKIHGLQLFLETPAETRNLPPKSVLIPVESMPFQDADGVRIKVVAGASGELVNPTETPEKITFLDIHIQQGKSFDYLLPAGWNGTIYLLSGTLEVKTLAGKFPLGENDTIALGASGGDAQLAIWARAASHFLLISGMPVSH
jgi:redox-sensitive bicupin YhaK (pirin superfamily)